MKYVILIFFHLALLAAKGQDTLPHSFLFKTDLVSYLPSLTFHTGKLNVEYEKPLGRLRSVAFSAAYIYSYGPSRPAGLVDFAVSQDRTTGFRAGVAYRRYFNRSGVFEPLCLLIWPLVFQLHSVRNENTGLYLSAQANYEQTFIDVPLTETSGGTYRITRLNPSLLLNVGFQSVNRKNLTVDQSIGIGAQMIRCVAAQPVEQPYYTQFYPALSGDYYLAVKYSLKVGLAFF
jgi:hypothetical protein